MLFIAMIIIKIIREHRRDEFIQIQLDSTAIVEAFEQVWHILRAIHYFFYIKVKSFLFKIIIFQRVIAPFLFFHFNTRRLFGPEEVEGIMLKKFGLPLTFLNFIYLS